MKQAKDLGLKMEVDSVTLTPPSNGHDGPDDKPGIETCTPGDFCSQSFESFTHRAMN